MNIIEQHMNTLQNLDQQLDSILKQKSLIIEFFQNANDIFANETNKLTSQMNELYNKNPNMTDTQLKEYDEIFSRYTRIKTLASNLRRIEKDISWGFIRTPSYEEINALKNSQEYLELLAEVIPQVANLEIFE